MAYKINIKGPIIRNDDKWIYDWFEMDATCPRDVEKGINEANGDDIELLINSPGGYVYVGSEIYTLVKEYEGNVIVKVVGVAASAASVIAMAGDEVLMSPTAQMMIHNVWSYTEGDYRDMAHEAEVLKKHNESIANAYILKTGLSKEELLTMMDNETWLTANQALEHKFIDEIMFVNGNGQQLVATLGDNGMLPPEVINKIRNRVKSPSEPEEQGTDFLVQEKAQAKLNLLKLGGIVNG